MRPVDLKLQRLHEAQTKTVDVLVTVGAYITHDEFRDLLKYLAYLIAAEGYLIVPFPYAPGIDNFTDNSFVFSNIITTPKGAIHNRDDIATIFKDTDFELTQTIKLSDLAKDLRKPMPADIEMIALARRK